MLRGVVVVLLLANLLSWAYTEGLLGFMGLAPTTQREPQRLEQQVNPDKLKLLQPDGQAVAPTAVGATSQTRAAQGADADNPPPSLPLSAQTAGQNTTPPPGSSDGPAACWLAPGYSRTEAAALRNALEREPLLQSVWQLDEGVLPARWIVYLGPFPNADALQRRRSELRQARVDHREVNNPALQPGLALGTYSTVESAQQALRDVRRQGIENARVEQEREDTPVYTLRLPAATATQKARVEALVAAAGTALPGRPLQICP